MKTKFLMTALLLFGFLTAHVAKGGRHLYENYCNGKLTDIQCFDVDGPCLDEIIITPETED